MFSNKILESCSYTFGIPVLKCLSVGRVYCPCRHRGGSNHLIPKLQTSQPVPSDYPCLNRKQLIAIGKIVARSTKARRPALALVTVGNCLHFANPSRKNWKSCGQHFRCRVVFIIHEITKKVRCSTKSFILHTLQQVTLSATRTFENLAAF